MKCCAMKRYVMTLAWVLWAHETAMVGGQLVDRGHTAIDSFESRHLCHAAMTDYAGLKLVRQGKVKIEFSCLPDKTSPTSRRTAIG
ncbi:MAG: hypothetical protein ACRELW_07465 [Candidatus Rokuibacteriota bacterium]